MSTLTPPADPIDRLSPARRPDRHAVMHQKWRSLLFLHWALPPEAVRPLLPPSLDLDLFEGQAYVGLVPFTMRGIRPSLLPAVPWLSNFHETNVRTYVHNKGRDPGVWFFSLDAANPVAVLLARRLFHLPYYHARMGLATSSVVQDGATRRRVHYTSRRLRPGPDGAPVSASISCTRPPGTAAPVTAGTLDHFLIERYLLYATRGDRVYRGQVHHPPYLVHPAAATVDSENLVAAAGLYRPEGPPLAHYVEGVDVEIFLPEVLASS